MIIALVAMCQAVAGQMVRLSGRAPHLAGMNINVETMGDYISQLPRTVGVIHVGNDGSFSDTLDVDRTMRISIDVGALRASAYVHSNAEYDVVMPPMIKKADADRFNPFFEPEKVALGIVGDTTGLNQAIINYDEAFGDAYHVKIINLVRSRNKQDADTLIAFSDSVAAAQKCDDPFFAKYVRYRNAYIYSMPRLRSIRTITRDCFGHDEVEFDVPTYWETFATVYQNYLNDYVRSRQGQGVRAEMQKAKTTFGELRSAMMTDTLFADTTLCEVVLLKSIYDASYNGMLSESRSDTILASAYDEARSDGARNIARNIIEKRTKLRAGSDAPTFSLMDAKGKMVSMEKYKGKFLYLGFLHTQNYQCLKDFASLSGVSKKYKRDLNVVGVLTDENFDVLETFFGKKKIDWQPLSFVAQQSIVLDYQIQSLPTYFLINPDGRIAVPNAPGPEEKIEQVIAEQMVKYKRDKLRNDPNRDRVRDIYDIVREGKKKGPGKAAAQR